MNDIQLLSDPSESSENVSAPHLRERQHGAKHLDFTASRVQAHERARLRVQQAIQEERERAREEAKSRPFAGLTGIFDLEHEADSASMADGEALEGDSAQDSEPELLSVHTAPSPSIAAKSALQHLEEPVLRTQYRSEEVKKPLQTAWAGSSVAESGSNSMSQAPADTLQGVRDRLASRWYALRELFEETAVPEPVAAPTPRPGTPVLAIFSLAGGVGKTSLAATLGRTFSARGERVLLVETTPFGLLPCFFGANERRPGVLRTFAPPEGETDAPVQMIALNADALAPDPSGHDPLAAEIASRAQASGRVIVDIATASAAVARRVLRMAPLVLVPVVPDMNSVVNVGFIDCLFHRRADALANSSDVYYVLNQFDPSLPLHLDIREVLREKLGDRLLPFVLRRTPAISEALAEGMTVFDYAPASQTTEEFNSLAGWVKAHSARASAARPRRRWTEK